MDGRGEVCLEAEVERLWRSGMNPTEISAHTGLDPDWIRSVLSPFISGHGPERPEDDS